MMSFCLCKIAEKGDVLILDCARSITKSPLPFRQPAETDVLLFRMRCWRNVFTFLMEYENYSFVEALRYLADRAGVDLPEQEYSEAERRRADEKAVLLEIHKRAAQFYYVQLKSFQGEQAMAYLRGRQLGDDTIKPSGLGIPASSATRCTSS